MRRIAKQSRFLSAFLLTIAVTLLSLAPANAAAKKASVIVKVDGIARVDQLATIRSTYTFLAGAVTPSPYLILQPAFRKIGLYPSIPRTTGRGVTIADLDTGADTCHEALQGVVTYTFVEGPDANAPENCPTATTVAVPGYGHGTRVASLLRLVAPEAALWAMRVFD